MTDTKTAMKRYELQDADGKLLGYASTLLALAYIEPWLGEQAYVPEGAAEMWAEDLARPESDGYVAATAVDGALVWIHEAAESDVYPNVETEHAGFEF